VSGYGTPYAAFAGYTTNLVGYVSVFNPISPTVDDLMGGQSAVYRSWTGAYTYPGEMYGANAPGSTWRASFDAANLGHSRNFGTVPQSSALWAKGNGQSLPTQPKSSKPGNGGGKGGNGGGSGGNGGGNGGGGKLGGGPIRN
jgi:hypothetical protein